MVKIRVSEIFKTALDLKYLINFETLQWPQLLNHLPNKPIFENSNSPNMVKAWGGHSLIKGTGVLVVPFRSLVLLRVLSLDRSTAGASVVPLRVLSQKEYDRKQCAVLELVPLRGEKNFIPRPQNGILVLLRGSFQKFRRVAPSFLSGGLPPPG